MSSVSNNPGRRLRRAGATSLELAIVFLIFIPMLMSVFDLARYLFTVQSMLTLMMDAGRYGLVRPGSAQLSGTPATWASQTTVTVPPLLDPSQGCVSLTFNNFVTGNGVNQVMVAVIYPFTASSPWLSGLSNTLPETPAVQQALQNGGCAGLTSSGMLMETATYSY
jgi:hypothetical protein